MSASTEQLVEEIKLTEKALEEALTSGVGSTIDHVTRALHELRQRLTKANEALTEGKQILKD